MARCIVAVSLLFLAGCAPAHPPTLPPGASMDGTYAVELGEITGLDGKPLARSGTRQTWAIRTACRDSGCVATVSVLTGGDPAKPPRSTGEFDFVDGNGSVCVTSPETARPRRTHRSG